MYYIFLFSAQFHTMTGLPLSHISRVHIVKNNSQMLNTFY